MLGAVVQTASAAAPANGSASISGPDGRVRLTLTCAKSNGGVPTYTVTYDGKTIIAPSQLGFTSNIGDFEKGLSFTNVSTDKVSEHYTLSHIKKSEIDFNANKMVCDFTAADGAKMSIEFLVADNDVAFRYCIPKQNDRGSIRIMDEKTSFAFPEATTTFLTPQSDAMIGWKRTKPSYEEEYVLDAPMTAKSQYGHGYTFPALFRIGEDGWALVSETGVDSKYCGSRLGDYSAASGYKVEFPMAEENNGNGTPEPAFALPGNTPWRTITLGATLKPIVETTITWDVVKPLYEPSAEYKPGRGTWSWILWQDNSINYNDIKTYIDFAAEMGYEYTLIDNWWDNNIGRAKMEELIRYAKSRGVEPVIWYSSSGYWNDIEQGPINRMDSPIARRAEMDWLKRNDVKGIKVDFWGGDKQETMRLYEQIFTDADDHGISVVVHGCTLPRGWERMYPNYFGSEAVLASENLVFNQHFCDEEAVNATTHPFIRNAVGCMEFGPVFLNKRLNKGNDGGTVRKTTDVFEVATAILFQNPVQMFALAPNNLQDAPAIMMDFMKEVPTTWDETLFIDGYPGKYVVLARRHGTQWYVMALNADKKERKIEAELPMLAGKSVTLYNDKKDRTPVMSTLKVPASGKVKLTLQPEGAAILK